MTVGQKSVMRNPIMKGFFPRKTFGNRSYLFLELKSYKVGENINIYMGDPEWFCLKWRP